MADTDTATELITLFVRPPATALEPEILAELQSIMRLHHLSPQDLFFKWESYCIKMDRDDLAPSLDMIRGLKQDIQDALERSNRAHQKAGKGTGMGVANGIGATPRTGVKGGDVGGILDGILSNTPSAARAQRTGTGGLRKKHLETPGVSRAKIDAHKSSPNGISTPSKLQNQLDSLGAVPASSFNDRPNPGEVVEVLNDHLTIPEPPIAPFSEPRIRLTAASDQKKLAYKPLAMKVSEASEILDDRIDDFANLVMEYHDLEPSAFGSAASQSTSEIVAVGRICSDTAEGKLNAASLVLETSRRMGGGLRVPLNLGKLKGYQFFPGQIVALRGSNTSGHEFVVGEVLLLPLMPNAASQGAALQAHRDKLSGGPDAMDDDSEPLPLNIMYASGPFTADDNLDFEPLHALCSRAADTNADAVVLTGPFLDADHPLIATGDFDLPDEAMIEPDTATMSTVFKYTISPALNRLTQANPAVTILMIPSVRDIIDKHVSWPQDIIPRKDLGLPKQAKIVGNPMTLSLNEVLLGISSQDILYELRNEELVGGKIEDTSLLSRLSRYLLEQRHYFPLFPPSDRSKLPKTGTADGVPMGAMLDVSYLKLGEMINVRPDVLVVPSALPPFAKVVESVLVINPGYLSKRKGAGTYARMTLQPPKVTDEQLSGGQMLSHKVFERARVEIVRI